MILDRKIAAKGWIILAEKRSGSIEQLSLRNVRLTQQNWQTEIALLSQALIVEGWVLIHHGQVSNVWSALFEREAR